MDNSLQAAARLLAEARSVAVLTGAGISAESGVPTFRDAQTGLWARYRAEDLATPEAFLRDPKLVWQWYAGRLERVHKAQPNAGHRALAKLQSLVPEFTLVTQNVDGLHQRAGSTGVVELHGSIARFRCFDRGHPMDVAPAEHPEPPPCPRCGSPARPGVVWFGEMLPPEALEAALDAAHDCGLMLCVGTSALVQPAASLPLRALDAGAKVVEINPQKTPLTPHAHHAIHLPAGEALPALLAAAFPGE